MISTKDLNAALEITISWLDSAKLSMGFLRELDEQSQMTRLTQISEDEVKLSYQDEMAFYRLVAVANEIEERNLLETLIGLMVAAAGDMRKWRHESKSRFSGITSLFRGRLFDNTVIT